MSTWILLRGLTRESRHWGEFPDLLQRECGDVELCAIDMPGNGSLNRQKSPVHVAEMVENCRAQLLERGVAPPYYLLAMSLGAMVATTWANSHPEELGGCVLINTSLRPFSPFHERLRPRNYLPLLSLLLWGRDHERRERTVLRLTSRHRDRPEKIAEWVGYAQQNPVSSRNALRQLIAAVRYEAPVSKPEPPLLILASAQDRLVNPRCSRVLAMRWSARYAEHPTAGHDLPLDDAPWVVRQAMLWYQTLPIRP